MAGKVSNKQIWGAVGKLLRSSIPEEERAKIEEDLNDMYQEEYAELVGHIEAHELDLTQLSHYNIKDIHKRLDYIEHNEKM